MFDSKKLDFDFELLKVLELDCLDRLEPSSGSQTQAYSISSELPATSSRFSFKTCLEMNWINDSILLHL